MFSGITLRNFTSPPIGKVSHPQRRGAKARWAALALALAQAPASAADVVPADPWEIIHAVRDLGPADVGRDDFRDPIIRADLKDADGAALDLPWEVGFYGCWMGRNCDAILLTLRLTREEWEEEPPEAEIFEEWNRTRLIGRAWIDDQGRAVLDHPVVIGPGLTKATLSQTLSAWANAMLDFAEHVDFPMK